MREDRAVAQDVERFTAQLEAWSHSVPGTHEGFERQAQKLLSLVFGEEPVAIERDHP